MTNKRFDRDALRDYYGAHFQVHGDRSVHYDPFDCAPAVDKDNTGGACC